MNNGIESKEGICHYHLCKKEGATVYKCPYCGNYFCKEHIKPKPPMLPPFKSTDKDKMNIWHEKGGHPCPAYELYWEKEQKQKKEGYRQILEKALGTSQSRCKVERYYKSKIPATYASSGKSNIKYHSDTKRGELKRWFFRKRRTHNKLDLENFALNIGVIIGLSLIFWLVYSNSEKINSGNTGILKIGGIIQLVLIFFIIRSLYKVSKNLKYGFTGLSNGYKLIVMILLILFCFHMYQHPNVIVNPLAEFDYNSFSPIDNEVLESKANIKNPSYAEMINFVMEDKTELNQWSYPDYVCEDFSKEVVKNAETKNIRAGLVHLESPDSLGHAIVAFETTDKGLYFLEPQTDELFSKAELDKMVEEGVYYPAPGGYYAGGMYCGSWTLSGYHIVYWNDKINIPGFEIILLVGAIVIAIILVRKNRR